MPFDSSVAGKLERPAQAKPIKALPFIYLPSAPPTPTPPPPLAQVGSYLGNAIGCGIGVWMLLNCGLMPQFANAVNAISVAKIAYPLKEVRAPVVGGSSAASRLPPQLPRAPLCALELQHVATACIACACGLLAGLHCRRLLPPLTCPCSWPPAADLHQGRDGQLVCVLGRLAGHRCAGVPAILPQQHQCTGAELPPSKAVCVARPARLMWRLAAWIEKAPCVTCRPCVSTCSPADHGRQVHRLPLRHLRLCGHRPGALHRQHGARGRLLFAD